jgi:SAM-dependent methyltransferase
MALPFDDGQFDLMACQFGVMFFPDKPAAFAETRRVLTHEGTVLASTWAPIETHDFQAALVAGLERAFPDDPPTFMVAVPHGYADLDIVVSDLRAGGLDCVTVESVTLEGHAASAADLAVGYCTGTPLRPAIEARGDLVATTAVVAKEMEVRLGAGAVTGWMTAHVIEATPAP